MTSTTASSRRPQPQVAEAWQLQMFRRSIKKQQKLRALLSVLGPLDGQRCLLITCGDNNGALNWHFRSAGGHWSWADAEAESVEQIAEVTGDPVSRIDKAAPALPYPDGAFDVVMTIDVHEHLDSPRPINAELARLARPGGKVVVTTPAGDQTKAANRLKRWVGMRKEDYGHVVDGYDGPDLARQLEAVRLRPIGVASYSGFFTEVVELVINLAYVKFMARRSRAKVSAGQIAPQNRDQMKSVEKTYKLYSLLYPFIVAFSSLDRLLPARAGYAVIVVATKE